MSDDSTSDNREIVTEWLQIPVGSARMPGYLARPAGQGPWPGVALGFEMFGVTGYLRDVAAQVAGRGYLALVPDFYHWQAAGEVRTELDAHTELPADADGRARGLELVNGLRREQVVADVRAAAGYLTGRRDSTGQTAMVGLSAGGHIAFYAATQVPLTALACFYPGWLTGTETGLSRPEPVLGSAPGLAAAGTPVLILAGADDHLYGPGELAEIEAQLTSDGVEHELIVYPDTPHGFACPERDTYRPEAAADAWQRTFGLLTEKFGTRSIRRMH
jgi:carboxymethylenebutenolidase